MADPDLIEILAHLDYLVDGPKTRSLQAKDTKEHIEKVLGELADNSTNKYTIDQIRLRLWDEFRKGDTYPDYNFARLFLHGSSEIVTLDQKTRESVQEQLRTIHLLKAQMPQSQRPRSKRLASATTHNQHTKKSGTVAQVSAINDQGKHRHGRLNCHASRKEKPYTARKRSKQAFRGQTKQCVTDILVIEIDETVSPSSECSASTTDSGPFAAFAIHEDQTPSSSSSEHVRCLADDAIDVKPRLDAEYLPLVPVPTDAYHHLSNELAYYKHRAHEAEQECTNLKLERRQLVSLGGAPQKEVTKVLCQNIRQISLLKQQLEDRGELERYQGIRNSHSNASNEHQFIPHFRTLKEQLRTVLVVNGTENPSIGALYGKSPDLDNLLSTIFGFGEKGKPARLADSVPEFPALTMYELIQSLTGAAIQSWIFQHEYRPHGMTHSPLLQKYRDHIAILCGHDGLYDFDTAVHRSIVQEDSFKAVTVPRLSSELTFRLLNALRPLTEKRLKHSYVRKLESSLNLVLSTAIHIRSLSLIGNEYYECVWPSIGSTFNSIEMEATNQESEVHTDVVRLPLCPGLRAYSKQGMVDYHELNHVMSSSAVTKYVVKALVMY